MLALALRVTHARVACMLASTPRARARNLHRAADGYYVDQVNIWGPLHTMGDNPLGMRAQHRERNSKERQDSKARLKEHQRTHPHAVENEFEDEAILLDGRRPNYWSECGEVHPHGFRVEFVALSAPPPSPSIPPRPCCRCAATAR